MKKFKEYRNHTGVPTQGEHREVYLFHFDGTKYRVKADPNDDEKPDGTAREVRETAFAELSDGSLAELIVHPEDSKRTGFAVWKDGRFSFRETLDEPGCRLLPIPRNSRVMRNVLLPSKLHRFESVEIVWSHLLKGVPNCVDLEDRYLCICTLYIMYSYFADLIDVAPYLLLVGAPQSGKTTLLKLLKLTCRHAWLLGDATPAALYRGYQSFMPTVLMDEAFTQVGMKNSSLRHLLRIGTSRASVARYDVESDVFGPKVLVANELPDDPGLLRRCIVIPMTETARTDLRNVSDPEVQLWGRQMRGLLTAMRLTKYKNFWSSSLPEFKTLRPGARDLADCFAGLVKGNELAIKALVTFFQTRTDEEQEMLSVAQRTTVSVLLALDHPTPFGRFKSLNDGWSMSTAYAAMLVNEELRLQGERERLSPRKLGAVLTSLGIKSRARTNRGIEISFPQETRRLIHRLARTHRVMLPLSPQLTYSSEACALCKELDPPVGSKNGGAQDTGKKEGGEESDGTTEMS